MSTVLHTLLASALSWPAGEHTARGKVLAIEVIPSSVVTCWEERGIRIRRACLIDDHQASLHIHVAGPAKYRRISAVLRCNGTDGLAVRVDNELVQTPTTMHDFVELVERIAEEAT